MREETNNEPNEKIYVIGNRGNNQYLSLRFEGLGKRGLIACKFKEHARLIGGVNPSSNPKGHMVALEVDIDKAKSIAAQKNLDNVIIVHSAKPKEKSEKTDFPLDLSFDVVRVWNITLPE